MISPRLLALHALLQQPDPEDLPTRGRIVTQPGREDREALKLSLIVAHLQYRAVQQEEERAA